MADSENNLILKNFNYAVNQLIETTNYFPKDSDISAVINSPSTLRVELSDLTVSDFDKDTCEIEINTKDFKNLKGFKRAAAERIHGVGDDFAKSMSILYNSGIRYTEISAFSPDFVLMTLKENNVKSFAQGCFINDFKVSSNFIAKGYIVVSSGGYYRKV